MALALALLVTAPTPDGWRLVGVSVTPHNLAPRMRFRREVGAADGALARLFVRADAAGIRRSDFRFDGRAPADLLAAGDWAWCDLVPSAEQPDPPLPPGTLTVLTFNTHSAAWTRPRRVELTADGRAGAAAVELAEPDVWLAQITFRASDGGTQPDRMVAQIENRTAATLRPTALRLHPVVDRATWMVLGPAVDVGIAECFPADGVPAGDLGGVTAALPPLPLSYVAVELELTAPDGARRSAWAHLRLRAEAFDISGGWISGRAADGASTCTHEAFLKTLRRLHIDTGHIGPIGGYTDQTGPDGLWTRYPVKYFWELRPLAEFDRDELLPRIHAAEYLGEPQYGGGRPVPPSEVHAGLLRYQPTRIASTVTLSDASSWRYYAGLSDYPHYDAYRVCAPAADAWSRYERWGEPLRWAAPLETIADMTRSLRELSRPAPIAYWSQGVHHGWDPIGGRRRTSPTPDELRSQAWFALGNRITSLYWFNLGLRSLVTFRDGLEPIARVGREIRLLDDLLLDGAGYRWHVAERDGTPDWELATVAGPRGAVLTACDLAYQPDRERRELVFGPPREVVFELELPAYLRSPAEVFAIDADGPRTVASEATASGVRLTDTARCVAVYVAAPAGTRARLADRLTALRAAEAALDFEPATDDADFAALAALLPAD